MILSVFLKLILDMSSNISLPYFFTSIEPNSSTFIPAPFGTVVPSFCSNFSFSFRNIYLLIILDAATLRF